MCTVPFNAQGPMHELKVLVDQNAGSFATVGSYEPLAAIIAKGNLHVAGYMASKSLCNSTPLIAPLQKTVKLL